MSASQAFAKIPIVQLYCNALTTVTRLTGHRTTGAQGYGIYPTAVDCILYRYDSKIDESR